MIYIGYSEQEKAAIIRQYINDHNIRNTVVISPRQFPLVLDWTDNVAWKDTIEYHVFYRLLQEIHDDSLVVLSEPMRTQNRYDLTYNCIRHFLNQTEHQLIFQHLPQIDTREDFMILFDFDTRSRWKRRKWDINLILDNAQVQVKPLDIRFTAVPVPTRDGTKKAYLRQRDKLFDTLGARDPHIIPRRLYLVGGTDKRAFIDSADGAQLSLLGNGRIPGQSNWYVARNQRLSRDCIVAYQAVAETAVSPPVTVVEFPHRFIRFSDFMKQVGQSQFDVLLADLKADRWYFQRYQEWKERIDGTYADLLEW